MAGRRAGGGTVRLLVVAALVAVLLLPPGLSISTAPTSDGSPGTTPSGSPVLRGDVPAGSASPSGDIGPVGGDSPALAPPTGDEGPGSIPVHPDSIVNPLQFYSREPAPMGIADFGVTGKAPGASAYTYFSPSFEGRATVRSMSVSITGSTSKVTAFELNAVLFLQRDGVNYTYWIQNGLHLDAASDVFSLGGAYVWNFSSPTARLSAGELQGDSSSVLVSDTYYYIPSCAAPFPGQCVALSLPASLSGRVVSSTAGGRPYVAFEYNLGSGWATYDNVSFLHMGGASNSGFRVDGFVPTPISSGLYYDAEWDWVGAGGGSASVDQSSDIAMSLELWNGHNYQAVPTAWNFGSNTGETSSNVSDLRATASAPEPSAHLASGAGSLGVLYNRTDVGFLNLTVPVPGPVTVVVDGIPFPFVGGWANLTILAGAHSLYLENYTNASAQCLVSAGATTFVDLSGAGSVIFTESGLPVGTTWGVTVNTSTISTGGSSLALNLPNGTYSVAYLGVPGFHRLGPDPLAVTLPGASRIDLVFAPFTYNVSFVEAGLPPATPWWVEANGTLAQGSTSTLELSAPNGSTSYEVGASYEFVADPSNGTFYIVNGQTGTITIDFSYRPTFVAGVVSPADAEVTIGGVAQTLAAGAYNDSVLPGTYLLVVNATGYVGQSVSVTATPGNVTWTNITLMPLASTVNPPPPASSGGPTISAETILAVVVVVVVVAGAVALLLLRRRS